MEKSKNVAITFEMLDCWFTNTERKSRIKENGLLGKKANVVIEGLLKTDSPYDANWLLCQVLSPANRLRYLIKVAKNMELEEIDRKALNAGQAVLDNDITDISKKNRMMAKAKELTSTAENYAGMVIADIASIAWEIGYLRLEARIAENTTGYILARIAEDEADKVLLEKKDLDREGKEAIKFLTAQQVFKDQISKYVKNSIKTLIV